MIIDPKNIAVNDLHQFILGAVAPRPIAFVSTVDEHGVPNLAPYSFFNAFSSNPPILVFSSNRRVGNNTTKDTLHNVQVTRQCVIQVVTHDIVRQMALSSIDYPADVDEFKKAGFTPLPSIHVKAFRVKESPVQMECEVQDIITLGDHGGAGHLVICRVLCMHVDERVLDENQRIDPDKIDLMGRLGRAYYARASGAAVETIYQPFNEIGIGFDQLPDAIRLSPILTGNEIAEFAALTQAPVLSEEDHDYVKNLSRDEMHLKVRELLSKKDVAGAAKLAWSDAVYR
jgi:flavin reductase (DIM6/NTAB) family NADH-FMN oxidoreductase RutF